jgi:hypothetical protein
MRVTRHSTRLSQPQGGAALAPLFNTPNSWAWTPGGLVSGAGLAQPTTVGAVNNYAITDGTARQVESLAAGIFIPPVARAQAGKIAFVFQFQLTSLDTASPNVIGFGNNGSVGSYVEQFTLNQDVGGGATAGKFRLSLRDAGGGRLDIGPTNVVFAIGGVYTVVVVATSGSTGRGSTGSRYQFHMGPLVMSVRPHLKPRCLPLATSTTAVPPLDTVIRTTEETLVLPNSP